jgi:hypothetical protein
MGWLRKILGDSRDKSSMNISVLQARREMIWSALGHVTPEVLSRLVPGSVPWPTSMLGKMRTIVRPRDLLLVTEGLSDPYEPELHPKPPAGPLDFELCLPIDLDDPSAASDVALADGPWPKLLYALADLLVEEWIDLRGPLARHGAITCQAPIGRGFGHGLEEDGVVGYLIGMPFDGSRDFDKGFFFNDFYAGLPVPYSHAAIGLLTVKVLRPGELAWALARGDDGARKLAEEFIVRGDAHRNGIGLAPLH